MARTPKFLGIHAEPTRMVKLIVGVLPFILLISTYLTVSHIRLTENPNDKLTPSISKMVKSVHRMAFTKDKRRGEYLMLKDTISSLRRIVIGLGLAAVLGLFLGINMGVFPGMNVALLPFTRFLSIIPPLSILPILFITFGVGELGKVMLIFIGSLFIIIRNIRHTSERIPKQQIVKALTLGASQSQVVYQILLPQIIPELLVTVRFCLGGAWLFLIVSEAIASTDGLGYRIFLVRRYLAMDIIIPYVLWITMLGFMMDNLLKWVLARKYHWYVVLKQ
jgi:NitT/TauT family transport system permease protein